MKKLNIFIIVLMATLIAIPAFALFHDDDDAEYQTVNIKQSRSLEDDAEVRIEGTIVMRLDEESFLLKDDSGMIKVDIDDDFLPIQTGSNYVISGEMEVDEEFSYLEASEVKMASQQQQQHQQQQQPQQQNKQK